MMPISELDALVRRFRAGDVYEPSSDPDSVDWSRVIAPLMSMAEADLKNQLVRLHEFSMPLLPLPPSGRHAEVEPTRTHPAKTARMFLSQLRSDFRCVAGPQIDLLDVETKRHTPEWAAALKKRGITNQSVAVLAVGRYLDFGHTEGSLDNSLRPLLNAADNADENEWFENNLGPVVAPLVRFTLQIPDAEQPEWAGRFGADWSNAFLIAGTQELRQAQTVSARPFNM